MKKKIFIYISLFCFVFTFVYVQPSKHYEAAILSKVATAGAKKVVKEVIKDMSVEMATNYALNEAFRIASEAEAKYKVQDNYKVICSTAVNGGACNNPVQIKTALSQADEIAVGRQAEIELEKLITNGKGFSRWQKFMDWFLPIWLVSLTVTALTYSLDPEVRSLFNEAGYNALVALGLIKELEKTESTPLATIDYPQIDLETVEEPLATQYSKQASFNNVQIYTYDRPNTDMIQRLKFNTYMSDIKTIGIGAGELNGYAEANTSNNRFYIANNIYSGTDHVITFIENGQVVHSEQVIVNSEKMNVSMPTSISIKIKQSRAILTRSPYEVNGYYYTDVLFDTAQGDVEVQIKSANPNKNNLIRWTGGFFTTESTNVSAENQPMMTVFFGYPPVQKVYPPVFDDVPLEQHPKSTYENNEGKIALIPPTAIPHKQTSTGTVLTPVIDETTGDKKYITPVGDEVPEEDITVEDPIIEKTPEGTTYTPPATETNPNPEPVPLTPPEPTPGGEEPPTDPPTTEEPPPEGGSKKPNVPIALLLGLFKLLIAIIYYLIRLFTFIVTIQFIEPTVIDNPTFQWFKTATVLGIQPYPLVINMAIFFLSFSIYKSIRRVFG